MEAPSNHPHGSARSLAQPDDGTTAGITRHFLSLAMEATNDGVWIWHVPSGKAWCNARYYKMLGYAPDEFVASFENWKNLLHPKESESILKTIQQQIDEKSDGYQLEFRMRKKSGRWLWILARGRVVERDADGIPIQIAGSHIDIDRRKRTEKKLASYRNRLEKMVKERTLALEQTTSLLEATFNAIPDILGVQDHNHRMIRYNAAGYAFLNKTHEEIVGKRCFELFDRTKECSKCATSQCYRTKKPVSLERYDKALNAWLDVRAYPILDENGNIEKVIEHLRDITTAKKVAIENRRLNDQLQQAQKMESLGTLAGGIAHDFNNLLMGIQGRISLMSMDLDQGHRHEEHTNAIEAYIQSATNLTKQLLGFARGGKYEVQAVDLNALMLESALLFGRTHKEIKIETAMEDGVLSVEVDRRQIEQVLLNIFINACQAMPDGGTLDLATRIVTVKETSKHADNVSPGPYAKMSISDTGCGMDEKTRLKIFDPFFTTKDKKRGTGLGLASAYGIIKNHHGFIAVQSHVGQGSTFNIFLPLSEKAVFVDLPSPEGLVTGSETILLVDDENLILDVGKAMLEKLGYRVVRAMGGEEALEKIRQATRPMDLVILDMIMPGLDGGKAFTLIREIQPDLPIILSSGYTMNHQAKKIMEKGCNGFIQKPFNLSELSKKIRSVLDAAHP